MGKGEYPGEFELVVLLALARLEEAPHGMAVYDEVVATTGRDVSVQAVYVTLKRLERKSLLSSQAGDTSASTRGRDKKKYFLSPAGTAALCQARLMYDRLWAGVSLEPRSP